MIDKNLKFQNNNIIFKLLEEKDVEDIVNMLEDKEVGRYLYFCPSPTEVYKGYFGGLAESIKKEEKPTNFVFTLRDKNTKEILGVTGLNSLDFVEGVYEVGYQIPRKHWNKGYGTLACEFLIFYAYNYLNFHRLTLDAYGENIGSLKIAEKLSFEKEACLRDYYKTNNGFDNKIIYGLLRDEIDKNRDELYKFRKL